MNERDDFAGCENTSGNTQRKVKYGCKTRVTNGTERRWSRAFRGVNRVDTQREKQAVTNLVPRDETSGHYSSQLPPLAALEIDEFAMAECYSNDETNVPPLTIGRY